MKLEEFKLETYREREALMIALRLAQSFRPDHYLMAEMATLLMRISRTQCQPGGCEYCTPQDG